MADKKTAKFFCENCGAEVPKDAKMCRHCGRFFSSVRCPQCGTTGSPSKFSAGCPVCGYAVGNPSGGNSKSTFLKDKKASRASKKALKNAIDERYSALNGRESRGDDSLPWWMYLAVTGALLLMIIFFFKFFR